MQDRDAYTGDEGGAGAVREPPGLALAGPRRAAGHRPRAPPLGVVLACIALLLAAWGRPAAMGLALPLAVVGLLLGDRRRLAARLRGPGWVALLAVLLGLEVTVKALHCDQGLLASYAAPRSPPEGERSVAFRNLEDATRIDRVLDFDEERTHPFARRFPLSFMNRRLHAVPSTRDQPLVYLADPDARGSFRPSARVRPVFEVQWRGWLVPQRTGRHVLRASGGLNRLELAGHALDVGPEATVEVELQRAVAVPLRIHTSQDASRPTRLVLAWGTDPESLTVVPPHALFPDAVTAAQAQRARAIGLVRSALAPLELALASFVLWTLYASRCIPSWRRGFLAVFLVALCLRIALHLVYFAQPHTGIMQSFMNDDWMYMTMAWDLLHKDPFAPQRAYHWAPLYRYFLVAVQLLVGESFRSIVLVQQVLGALTCALTYRIGERLFGLRAALWAGGLCAFSPFLAYWETTTYVAAFGTLLATCALDRMVVAARRGTYLSAASAGLVAGLTCLARPNLALFVAFSCALLLLRMQPLLRGLKLAAAACAAALLAISPATTKNVLAGGGFVPIGTNGPVNLYIGNHAGATGAYVRPPADVDPADYVTEALAFVRDDTRRWILLERRKLRRLLFQEPLWPFYVGGLAGWLVARRRRVRAAWPLSAMATAVLLVPILFFLDDRFLLPAIPPLAVYTGFALDALGAATIRRRKRGAPPGLAWRTALPLLLALGVLYVVVCTYAFSVLNGVRAPWNLGPLARWLRLLV